MKTHRERMEDRLAEEGFTLEPTGGAYSFRHTATGRTYQSCFFETPATVALRAADPLAEVLARVVIEEMFNAFQELPVVPTEEKEP